MAVTKPTGILAPATSTLLTPIIPALTAAAVSKEPAENVLPLLSPILRQRVQFLAPSSTEPWLRLLCYDASKAAKLSEIATNGSLEPHPVSGEIEVDWDYDCETRFRRIDAETLQAFVVLKELGLAFQLIYCEGDKEGGGDGWRIGEVTVPEQPDAFSTFDGGVPTVDEAERHFEEGKPQKQPTKTTNGHLTASNATATVEEEEDDDDDYWGRYDTTPARTPAPAESPAPQFSGGPVGGLRNNQDADDAYFSRYDTVQPAMDNHDPDEEVEQESPSAPPLGLALHSPTATNNNNTYQPETDTKEKELPPAHHESILHPRPESSASSRSSNLVEKLEEEADRKDQSDFGVKKHISRSIRSLFMLSRASGIEREEFEQLVQAELDVLGMVEDMS